MRAGLKGACWLCDITSALGVPFRRWRTVLFFHFRPDRCTLAVLLLLPLSVPLQTASSSLVHINRIHPTRQEKKVDLR